MRSPLSIICDIAFIRVVLPAPVPPEISTLSRAREPISSTVATGLEIEPLAISISSVMRRRANLRIEMQAPFSASGGKTMLTREPSARRASTIGLLSSTRRPTAAAMRWAMLAACAASRKRTLDSRILPRCSTNTRSGPLTMMSVMVSSSSSGSSGPRPSMSSTSSPASCRCSRPLSWMCRPSAISASSRSTSTCSRSGVVAAAIVGSRRERQIARSSSRAFGWLTSAREIAITGSVLGGGGGASAGRRPNPRTEELICGTASSCRASVARRPPRPAPAGSRARASRSRSGTRRACAPPGRRAWSPCAAVSADTG